MLENIRLSLKGIWSHKMRSFLTMLGIIIGIAAIIAIVSTIKGTNEQIKNNLIGSGTNAVTVQLYQNNYPADFSYSTPPEGVPTFDDSVKEKVLALDGVEQASFFHSRDYCDSLFYLNNSLSGSVYGVDGDYIATAGLQVTKGRGFSNADLTQSKNVCLIDETTADAFGGANPIGAILDVMGQPFTVIGVVSQKSQFEPVINSMQDYYTYNQSSNGKVYLPDQMWPVVFQYDEPQSVLIRAASTDDMTRAGKQTADLLNGYLTNVTVDGEEVQYQSKDLADEASQLQQLSSSTNTMLIWHCLHLPAGGRHRRHEHHAGVRHRAHPGNRPEKGTRRPAAHHSRPVPDRGRHAEQHRRIAGHHCRHHPGPGHLHDRRGARGHQHAGHSGGSGILHGGGHHLRSCPFGQSRKSEPHRRSAV